MQTTQTAGGHRNVALWLSAGLAGLIIVTGAYAQFNHTGPAITTWGSITRVVPPLSQGDWKAVLGGYQSHSQYMVDHATLSMATFRSLYLVEWSRVFLSALLDLTVLFAAYGAMRAAPETRRRLMPAMAALLTFAVLRTLFIWVVLPAGVGARADIAGAVLAIRSGSAAAMLMLSLWLIARADSDNAGAGAGRGGLAWAAGLLAVVALVDFTIGALAMGAQTASAFTGFPLVNGQLIPSGMMLFDPWWKNFAENAVTIQFMHRGLSVLLLVLAFGVALASAGTRQAALAWTTALLVSVEFLTGAANILAPNVTLWPALYVAAGLGVLALTGWLSGGVGAVETPAPELGTIGAPAGASARRS